MQGNYYRGVPEPRHSFRDRAAVAAALGVEGALRLCPPSGGVKQHSPGDQRDGDLKTAIEHEQQCGAAVEQRAQPAQQLGAKLGEREPGRGRGAALCLRPIHNTHETLWTAKETHPDAGAYKVAKRGGVNNQGESRGGQRLRGRGRGRGRGRRSERAELNVAISAARSDECEEAADAHG